MTAALVALVLVGTPWGRYVDSKTEEELVFIKRGQPRVLYRSRSSPSFRELEVEGAWETGPLNARFAPKGNAYVLSFATTSDGGVERADDGAPPAPAAKLNCRNPDGTTQEFSRQDDVGALPQSPAPKLLASFPARLVWLPTPYPGSPSDWNGQDLLTASGWSTAYWGFVELKLESATRYSLTCHLDGYASVTLSGQWKRRRATGLALELVSGSGSYDSYTDVHEQEDIKLSVPITVTIEQSKNGLTAWAAFPSRCKPGSTVMYFEGSQ